MVATPPKSSPVLHSALVLRIELQNIEPVIYRTLVVPANITLPKLHRVFQVAMGWYDEHLHEFIIAGERYARILPDAFQYGVLNERGVRLDKVLGRLRKFEYVYDFGDDWTHTVRWLRSLKLPEPLTTPYCLEGENACPPEDVGGFYGYYEFCEAMADVEHPGHDEMLDWHGEVFDPRAFDLTQVNVQLQHLKL